MKTLMKALVLSLASSIAMTSAFAAPQEPRDSNHSAQPHAMKHEPKNLKAQHPKAVKPSKDWKVGQKIPTQYHAQSYKIEHTKYKKLNKPNKNQQWLKVNGDYVLINTLNHHIVKIITG